MGGSHKSENCCGAVSEALWAGWGVVLVYVEEGCSDRAGFGMHVRGGAWCVREGWYKVCQV